MVWHHFQNVQFPVSPPTNLRRRYSITADVLSYQECPLQYEMLKIRKYEPSLAVQLFYGTIIHQVLDRAHAHYRGVHGAHGPGGSIPTDQDIEKYFTEVESALKARKIRAVDQVRDQALELLQRFNSLEGPVLYPRIVDTECKLQADQANYILHGNVDVIAVDGSDGYEIWDYKGTEKPSISSPSYHRYVYQMQVYAELYRRRTGHNPVRAVLYFLNELSGPSNPTQRPVNALLSVPLNPASINNAMQAFDNTVQSIEQGRATGNWPDPTQDPGLKTCNACDRRWQCSAVQSFGRSYNMLYP